MRFAPFRFYLPGRTAYDMGGNDGCDDVPLRRLLFFNIVSRVYLAKGVCRS